MFVYAVILSIAYEGDTLLGIFSDYVKAREYVLSLKIDEHGEIRKVELDKVYSFMNCGENV